jgi:hypothetical protein
LGCFFKDAAFIYIGETERGEWNELKFDTKEFFGTDGAL